MDNIGIEFKARSLIGDRVGLGIDALTTETHPDYVCGYSNKTY